MKPLSYPRLSSIAKSNPVSCFLGLETPRHRCNFHLPVHAADLLRIAVTPNCFVKRTLRGNAKKAGEKSEVDSDLNYFVADTNSKPYRKPPPAPSEHSKQMFTVSNAIPVMSKEDDKNDPQPKEKKAIDIAIALRKEKAKEKSPFDQQVSDELDSIKRASRALTMPRLEKLSDEDLARLIRRNVVYADKQFVIFNKPYGLPMHDGDKTKKHIKTVLPMVSKMVYGVNTDIPLSICNRLDKFTTGLCVTTTNDTTTRQVQIMFREHKILKKYWAITLFPPNPSSGIIDIPLDRSVIESDKSYARMVVKPDIRYDPLSNKEIKVHSKGQIAITHYSTLDANALALVELQPLTSIMSYLF